MLPCKWLGWTSLPVSQFTHLYPSGPPEPPSNRSDEAKLVLRCASLKSTFWAPTPQALKFGGPRICIVYKCGGCILTLYVTLLAAGPFSVYPQTSRTLPQVRCLCWALAAPTRFPSQQNKPWVVMVSTQLCTPPPCNCELGVGWGGMAAHCVMTKSPFKDRTGD